VNLVAAPVALGQCLREPGDGVERLMDVPRLVKDPTQVKGFILDRGPWALELAQVSDVGVEDVLAPHWWLDLVPLDAVIHIMCE